jgi:hypothetical protein
MNTANPPKLQSSLRNTLHTFGPSSPQYASIKKTVEEYEAKAALRASQKGSSRKDEDQGGEAKTWGGNLVIRVKGQ